MFDKILMFFQSFDVHDGGLATVFNRHRRRHSDLPRKTASHPVHGRGRTKFVSARNAFQETQQINPPRQRRDGLSDLPGLFQHHGTEKRAGRDVKLLPELVAGRVCSRRRRSRHFVVASRSRRQEKLGDGLSRAQPSGRKLQKRQNSSS